MELMAMAEESQKFKKNVKLHLDSLNIDAADGGGFIVRCQFEGRKDGDHEYESKTKVFTSTKKLVSFLTEALGDLGIDIEEDEEEDEEEDY